MSPSVSSRQVLGPVTKAINSAPSLRLNACPRTNNVLLSKTLMLREQKRNVTETKLLANRRRDTAQTNFVTKAFFLICSFSTEPQLQTLRSIDASVKPFGLAFFYFNC